MAVIETKFGMGDVVWHATTTVEHKKHPCPDCLGSRKWEAKSPAGGTFSFDCPRCANNYMNNQALSLGYSEHTPAVSRLTIGLVRTFDGYDGGHRYMAHETGIGSGALYDEDRLFATEEEAKQHAQALADAANADPNGWVAQQFSGRLDLSDYQLKDASIKAAEDLARSARIKLQIFSENIANAEDMDDVRTELRVHFPDLVEA